MADYQFFLVPVRVCFLWVFNSPIALKEVCRIYVNHIHLWAVTVGKSSRHANVENMPTNILPVILPVIVTNIVQSQVLGFLIKLFQ